MEENKVGRPTIMTEMTIKKLEEVFAIGGTDEEACFYADISKQTLYDYQKKYPEFVDRKEALKEKPILKARQTVVQSLNDPNHAFRYLERKRKKEFGNNMDITTDGKMIPILGGLSVNNHDIYENNSNNEDSKVK